MIKRWSEIDLKSSPKRDSEQGQQLLMSILTSNSTRAFTPRVLWQQWPEARLVTTPAPCLRHAELLQSIHVLISRYLHRISQETIGQSCLGRSIQMLTLGVGNKKIMLWSQMHGDEPSATPALLDIADYLLAHSDQPEARSILENYTLLMIPMLNPDGAELYQRLNAQGLDINRDALHLATPEGRLLKRIRDEYEPMLGLNLHDQNRMTTVGDTGRLATVSVLAVSGDIENTLTRGRLRSKRACTAIAEALAPYIPGGIARYDEGWSPRAFGDNITAWGTPVVLIESGGLPAGHEITDLTRLNFVAILTVLTGLAEDDLAAYDPQIYENLAENQTDAWSDIVVRGGRVLQSGTAHAFRADLAFNYLHNGRQAAECGGPARNPSQIFLLGDASFHAAGTSVDAHGKVILPAFDVGVKGWPGRDWLNQDNLAHLAQMGVGTICWAVDATENLAARLHAETLGIQGLPRIEVQTNPAGFPAVILSGPPLKPTSTSLSAVLAGLGLQDMRDISELGQLWLAPAGSDSPPARLRKDQPASFLIVSAASDGQIDIDTSNLVSVWLDGHRV